MRRIGWNDTGKGKAKNWERNLSRWHCARRSEWDWDAIFYRHSGFLVSLSINTLLLRGKMQNYTRSTLKSPRQCPLVLLVKVAWRQVRASRIKGGIVLRLECCGVRGTGGGMKLSVWREFRIWMAASWRNFDRFGRAAFWRKFSFQFCGRGWHEKRAVRCEVMYLLSFPNQRFKCQLQRAVG